MNVTQETWDVLGIYPTNDIDAINRAYKDKLKYTDPTNYAKRQEIRDAHEIIINNLEYFKDECMKNMDTTNSIDMNYENEVEDNSLNYYRDIETFRNIIVPELNTDDLDDVLGDLCDNYSTNKYFLIDLKNIIIQKKDVINYDCLRYIHFYIEDTTDFEHEDHPEVEAFLIDIKKILDEKMPMNKIKDESKKEVFNEIPKPIEKKDNNEGLKKIFTVIVVAVVIIVKMFSRGVFDTDVQPNVVDQDIIKSVERYSVNESNFNDDTSIITALKQYTIKKDDNNIYYIVNFVSNNKYESASDNYYIKGRYIPIIKDKKKYLLNVIDESLEGPYSDVTAYYEPNSEIVHYYMISDGNYAAVFDDNLNQITGYDFDIDFANYTEAFDKSIVNENGLLSIKDADFYDYIEHLSE